MKHVSNYLSLIKFSHTIFAMPFAAIGFFTAWYQSGSGFTVSTLLLVMACMVLARSAAMAFNRYLDRYYDALNPRTAIREIPSGKVSPKNALFFTLICCVGFVVCTAFINTLCFYLSWVALAVVLGYSYTKRFTALCHLVLGLGLSLAPVGAWLAVTGSFDLLPILFGATVFCWVSGFDIIYALQDVDFDKSHQLHSIPAAMGKRQALRVSSVLHLLSTLFLVLAGWYGVFGWLYWVGVCFFALLLIYQHRLVKPNNLSKVNLAFFTTNGIASVVFALFVVLDLFIR